MKETRQKINDLLHYEVGLKARYLKKNYYESGPKAAKLQARRLKKQKVDAMVTELYDSKLNTITNKPKEIKIFLNLLSRIIQPVSDNNPKDMDIFLDNLELPLIERIQNGNITVTIAGGPRRRRKSCAS